MKRILILTILLMSSLAWAGSTTVVVGMGVTSAPAGCAGGSDGVIGSNGEISGDVDNGNASTGTLTWSEYTPTSDGSITYGHYTTHYNEAAGGYSRIVLMDESGNVLDHSAQQDPNANNDRTAHHVEMEHNYCLVADTTYLIGVWIAADNWAGPSVTYVAFDYWYHKAGMSWSDTSFDLSSSTDHINAKLRVTLNNSSDTP